MSWLHVDEGVALPYIETPATPRTRTPRASQATLAIFANRGFARVSDIAISVSSTGTLALWGLCKGKQEQGKNGLQAKNGELLSISLFFILFWEGERRRE